MKIINSILSLFSLLSVVSCYEGSELATVYDHSYKEPVFENISNKSANFTSAQISFSLQNTKYESEIYLYYSEEIEADLLTEGEKVFVASADPDSVLNGNFSVELNNLYPNTKYRYCITYTDAGDHFVQTKECTFTTKSCSFWVYMHDSPDYFQSNISYSFYELPDSARYGIVVGTTKDVSVDNFKYKEILGVWDGTSILDGEIEFTDLESNCTYYYRGFVNYRDRIYYKNYVDSFKTPQVDIKFVYISVIEQTYRNFYLRSTTTLQNRHYGQDSIPSVFEYGFQISQSPSFSKFDSYSATPDKYGRFSYTFSGAKEGNVYYTRAFFSWPGHMEKYSDVVKFGTLKSKLSGDIDTLMINGCPMPFVLVKAGSFMMGATDEQAAYAREDEFPAHQETISQDYYISQYEVTQDMVSQDGSNYPSRMQYTDVMRFISKFKTDTRNSCLNLPTEAEWEYAARGGHLQPEQTLFAGSDDIDEVAWVITDLLTYDYFNRPIYPTVHEVGQKKPNALGLYDMSGNVAEWTLEGEDVYIRGGGAHSYYYAFLNTDYRVSARCPDAKDDSGVGFRLIFRNN